MENNNGKGIFYGVIGVATLIVAIIGATFAYFTATTTSSEYVQGQAATASLKVNVRRMTGWSESEGNVSLTPDTEKGEKLPSYVMVPQPDTTLDDALVGTGGNECIDAGGSLVCSIYKIVVQNTGSAAITVNGYIDFYSSSTTADGQVGAGTEGGTGEDGVTTIPFEGDDLMYHLKWARLDSSTIEGKDRDATIDGVQANYTYDQILADTDIPTNLLVYTKSTTPYQTTPDNTSFYYLGGGDADGKANQYLYGIEAPAKYTNAANQQVDSIDWLGGHKVTGAHGRHTDLIDPTDDLTITKNGTPSTATATATVAAGNTNPANDGKWYLSAMNNPGDTKVFYIVVWISENHEAQNKTDFGQFTGAVTFKSMAGSGATSTFSETIASGT